MHTGFKKLLINMLILAVIVLPLRMAFSMPIENSGGGPGQHCRAMTMVGMAQNVLTQSFDTLSSDMQSTDVDDKSATKGGCCNTSGNDCAGCAHITAVYYYDYLQLSDPSDNEVFSEAPLFFITRITPPPSRPPLILHI